MNTLTSIIGFAGNVLVALVLVLALLFTFFGALLSIAVQTPIIFVCVALSALTAASILFVHNTWLYTID
jgi:hypothetical protein